MLSLNVPFHTELLRDDIERFRCLHRHLAWPLKQLQEIRLIRVLEAHTLLAVEALKQIVNLLQKKFDQSLTIRFCRCRGYAFSGFVHMLM